MALRRALGATRLAAVDGQRTILVLSSGRELAVALRERLDRALVTVAEVWPGESVAAVAACRPWPWMVVGEVTAVGPALAGLLTARPTLLVWRCPPPPGLPTHTRVARSFSELVETVAASLGAEVHGIRLAVGGGVTLPDGSHAASPVLEALVASHPDPVAVGAGQLRSVLRTLAAHALPLRLHHGPAGAVLVEEGH